MTMDDLKAIYRQQNEVLDTAPSIGEGDAQVRSMTRNELRRWYDTMFDLISKEEAMPNERQMAEGKFTEEQIQAHAQAMARCIDAGLTHEQVIRYLNLLAASAAAHQHTVSFEMPRTP
jgi:hypothetical protein